MSALSLDLGGVAAGLAAHTLGRSASAHIAASRDAAWPAVATAVAACGLVLVLGRRGLVVDLVFASSLAAALLLGWSVAATRPLSARARLLGRWALLVAAGLALIAAAMVLRSSAWVAGVPTTTSPAPGALVAIAGLLAVAAPPLAALLLAVLG